MPRINLSKIGSAAAAASTGALLAVTPVFAQTTPTAPGPASGTVITIIINAAEAASVTYTFTISAEMAAELAAKLAAHQAELAAETQTTTQVDEDVDEEVEVDDDAAPATATKKTVTVAVSAEKKTAQHESDTEKD